MTTTESAFGSNDSRSLETTVEHLETVVEELTTELDQTKTIVNDLRQELAIVTQALQALQLENRPQETIRARETTAEAELASATTTSTFGQDITIVGGRQTDLDRYNRYQALIPRSRYYIDETEALSLPKLNRKPNQGDLVIVAIKSASKTDNVPQLGLIGVISQPPRRTSDFVTIEVYTGKTYQKRYTSLAGVDPNTIDYPKANTVESEEWSRLMSNPQ